MIQQIARWFVFAISIEFALANLVTEHEPNDNLSQANAVQCGDTIVCGQLESVRDVDNFRFFIYQDDSIVAAAFPCDGRILTNTFMVLFNDQDSVVAVDDNNGPQEFSMIRYLARTSGFYTIRIMRHYVSNDSVYSLSLTCPVHLSEAYDYCATPRIIPAFPYYDEGTTLGMTSQCGSAAPDVFYKFNNPIESNLFITVCTEVFNARVQILGRCCLDFYDDADAGCGLGAALISFSLPPGDYFILVEGTAANQAGNFSLDVNAEMPGCPPPAPVTISSVGGYPFLDWPEFSGPSYYVVWFANNPTGPFDHLGITFYSFYVDSLGYTGSHRFYQVTSVCPW